MQPLPLHGSGLAWLVFAVVLVALAYVLEARAGDIPNWLTAASARVRDEDDSQSRGRYRQPSFEACVHQRDPHEVARRRTGGACESIVLRGSLAARLWPSI